MFESGIFDGFFFLGPNPRDIFKQYTTITGSVPLPPVGICMSIAISRHSFVGIFSFGQSPIINAVGITMTKMMFEGKF